MARWQMELPSNNSRLNLHPSNSGENIAQMALEVIDVTSTRLLPSSLVHLKAQHPNEADDEQVIRIRMKNGDVLRL